MKITDGGICGNLRYLREINNNILPQITLIYADETRIIKKTSWWSSLREKLCALRVKITDGMDLWESS